MISLNHAKLETLTEYNLDLVLNWRNQEFVRSKMFNSEVISGEEHYNWFKNNERLKESVFKIFFYNEKPLGFVQFSKIDSTNGICEWSFYLGEKDAPRGMGTILGITALNFLFDELCIRKLCAQVIENNKISYNFHKELGFKEEGCLKDHIVRDNIYQNVYLFALFSTKWNKNLTRLEDKIKCYKFD